MKKQTLLLVGCLACLSPASQAGDEALWQALFDLGNPAKAERAEGILTGAGKQGLEVLSRAAQLGHENLALREAAREVGCEFFSLHDTRPHGGFLPQTPHRAAALAARMLAADPGTQAAYLRSPSPFERKLAIISMFGKPKRLQQFAAGLGHESNPGVIGVILEIVRCDTDWHDRHLDPGELEAYRSAHQQASSRREEISPEELCEQPGKSVDALLEGLVARRYKYGGSQHSGSDVAIIVRRDDGGESKLAPPCAFALYDALAKRRKHIPWLLLPIALDPNADREAQRQAATRAVRDLKHYEARKRNRIAAKLINAGIDVEHRVTFQGKNLFDDEVLLEAAARQGSPGAREAIERAVLCRGSFDAKRIALLGFLGTRSAADQAAELAKRCPKTVDWATTALLRLDDPRAVGLLEDALNASGFGREGLHRAILNHYTQAIDAELRRLAKKRVSGVTQIIEVVDKRASRPGP